MSAKPASKPPRIAVDCCRKGCFLCNEVNNQDPLSQYLGRYVKPDDKFVAMSNHFVAMPDINPVVPGHTLLMTRDHMLSMAQVSSDWYEELSSLKEEIFSGLSQRYGKVFCFEHGAAVSGVASGICIEHAHLHFIPAEVRIEEQVEPYVAKAVVIEPIDFTSILDTVTGTYLYYEDNRQRGFLAHPAKPLPEQFIRRVVATSYGLSKWDWKEIALPYLL
jgi:diadenosine tetraphosphate (Ap4A) HIT family hydrolase